MVLYTVRGIGDESQQATRSTRLALLHTVVQAQLPAHSNNANKTTYIKSLSTTTNRARHGECARILLRWLNLEKCMLAPLCA